ncbi:MAG: TetM/TetW/TetO/TetS family tetracycline resistance ribosomal protection protein [Clostridiales bacterium]|nr:TetM/TetW/TetO/TetS family tetracycline resistance ribosomal protection protein [Clostridiales bacterium]
MNNIRNIGILAHVDAGKTTITERMLYMYGEKRSLGSVDDGTASTDSLEVERARGISVRSARASFDADGIKINIIDTPGHADFISEVERALTALDGAVLVLSAVEGIQAQTEVLWKALRTIEVPTIVFINKTDRLGADADDVTEELRERFSTDFFTMNDDLFELAAERNEKMEDMYLSGITPTEDELKKTVRRLTKECRLFPVLSGSALKGEGIDSLVKAIKDYLPSPHENDDSEPSGIVYKLEHDKKMGRAAHVRMFSGTLRSRDSVKLANREFEGKISQIRSGNAGNNTDIGEVKTGDIAVLYGLGDIRSGDVIGRALDRLRSCEIASPLLKVQAIAEDKSQYPALASALRELSDEDPMLGVEWEPTERELCVNIMGRIQLEIIGSLLRDRYDLEVIFGPPSVIYKETISSSGYGYADYTMPKPCWAVIELKMEPRPRGSGVIFESTVRDDRIYYRYQHQVRQAIPDALKQGMYGWEVTDIAITLVGGSHHTVHTHPLDFIVATPMGIMDGLSRIGTTLLEPMLKVRVTVPEELSGRVIGDFIAMRGELDSPVIKAGTFVAEGILPVATSLNYSQELKIASAGQGFMTASQASYRECPIEMGNTTRRRGINPLDTAKYILWVRGAITEGLKG